MNLFGVLDVAGSALGAERLRAEVVASNMANLETTRTAEGGPYRRRFTVFRAQAAPLSPLQLASFGPAFGSTPDGRAGGVRIERVVTDPAPPFLRYQPGHPDADAKGYVAYPAINPVEEMTDLMGAVRAYEMNASSVQAAKQMIQQSIDILK
jgi:flagellar basal-body rod protein FlgC